MFPADILLCSYLKCALHTHDLLSLPVLLSTFIEASASENLHDTTTLDMLCHLIQEEYYATGLPPDQSFFSADTPLSLILQTISGSLNLLRTAHGLPRSPFHNVIASSSQLTLLLLPCVGNRSTVSASEAMVYYSEVLDILQIPDLSNELRDALGRLGNQLSTIWGDDVKLSQEAQLLQRIQLSMGKGDIIGSNSESDLITCSLLLRQLVRSCIQLVSTLLVMPFHRLISGHLLTALLIRRRLLLISSQLSDGHLGVLKSSTPNFLLQPFQYSRSVVRGLS